MNPESHPSQPGHTVKHSGQTAGARQASPRPVPVGICILLDATGSMAEEIAGVVKALLRFVDILRESALEPILGLIVFRDELINEQPKILPLGTKPETICHVLRSTVADGGGDDPESSYPAIMRAVESLSALDAGVRRIILHITDAPPHEGEQGHTAETVRQFLMQHRIRYFACAPAIEPYTKFANVTGGTLFPISPDIDAETFKDVFLAVAHQTVRTVLHDGPALTDELRALLKGASQ